MSQDSRYASRKSKSKKITAILQDFLGSDISNFTCLDIGCSSGGITNNIAEHFHSIVGIDIDHKAVIKAKSISTNPSTIFTLASGNSIPFKTCSFDVVICAQVYEHTTEQQALSEEIWRVLHPGGVCFFSGPNRLAVMEEHYWLPFLSWLPHPLANIYMKMFRRGNEYDAHPLFYWQIRKIWKDFEIHDYTYMLLNEPERFATQTQLRKRTWIRKLPKWFVRAMAPFYTNYNWVLIKRT